LIFEKEKFPRPHVGESLVPSSIRVFRELNFLPTMENYRFPHKYGAVWTSAHSDRTYEHDWEGITSRKPTSASKSEISPTCRLGATARQGVQVTQVNFDERRPVMSLSDGSSVRVRMVADAAGRNTMLANQLRLKVMDKVFDQLAVHTWFEGYHRVSAFGVADSDHGTHHQRRSGQAEEELREIAVGTRRLFLEKR
jgi:2-polyprenyl-6-methoxyphenol hydroxylase-like FAD-dependent oxidoreductase